MAVNILVVDDEKNMLTLLKRVLGKEGYHIECTDSGAGAVKLASAISFQLAIVDVSMPGMDGIEVLTKLKEMSRDISVIMISAYSSWEKERTARRLGCSDYLSKPLDMKRLKVLVKEKIRTTNV
jgi:two-component system response regulator PilR (NtrC family)